MMKKFVCFAWMMVLLTGPAGAEVGEDGLHKQPWLATTFKDVREDMQSASDEGKRLAIIVEQRGCIYCRKLHEEVFSRPEIADYITENFVVVQYNMFGDEEVTDLDGEVITEKLAVRKWRYNYTPTIVFLPDPSEAFEGDVSDAAVSVLPGAFGKGTTLNMFRWVKEKGYQGEEHFQKYHARKLEEAKAAGN